jgi:hypothetical protein
VIKLSWLPSGRVVAHLARLRESLPGMVGIVGALVILQVTGNTTGVGQVVVIVDVTLGTGHSRMRAGQGEA